MLPNTQASSLRRTTAWLLILAPVLFMAVFTLLGFRFEYPDILRRPAGYVLEQFRAGGAGLIALWYGMLLSALAFVALPVLVHQQLAHAHHRGLRLATTFGILAGLVQAMGFARWVFVVPTLAEQYTDPTASEITRAAIQVVFVSFNQYAGVGLGEHLGYLFTALWTGLIAAILHPQWRWLGGSGMALAAGIAAGLLEPSGVSWAGPVNAISYSLWALWLMAFGILLLRCSDAKPQGSSAIQP
jgi:F0F1-type ATP synthase assembly protein I